MYLFVSISSWNVVSEIIIEKLLLIKLLLRFSLYVLYFHQICVLRWNSGKKKLRKMAITATVVDANLCIKGHWKSFTTSLSWPLKGLYFGCTKSISELDFTEPMATISFAAQLCQDAVSTEYLQKNDFSYVIDASFFFLLRCCTHRNGCNPKPSLYTRDPESCG